MTRTEYYEEKKVFDQFKKELKKEIGDAPKFIMSYAQFCNRTFTAFMGESTPWENIVAEWETPDARKNYGEAAEKIVAIYKQKIAEFGSPEKEISERIAMVVNSNALKKFSELWGIRWATETKTEYGRTYVYIRFRF